MKLSGNMPDKASNMLAVPKSSESRSKNLVIPSEVENGAGGESRSIDGEARRLSKRETSESNPDAHYTETALRDPSTPLRMTGDV